MSFSLVIRSTTGMDSGDDGNKDGGVLRRVPEKIGERYSQKKTAVVRLAMVGLQSLASSLSNPSARQNSSGMVRRKPRSVLMVAPMRGGIGSDDGSE